MVLSTGHRHHHYAMCGLKQAGKFKVAVRFIARVIVHFRKTAIAIVLRVNGEILAAAVKFG